VWLVTYGDKRPAPGIETGHGHTSRITFGTRAFSVAGPTVCNSLPDHLRDPGVDSEQLMHRMRDLKTYLFAGHSKH